LLALETDRPGLSRIPIRADGSAGEPELGAQLPLGVPDGVAAAADGSLDVACYRPDAIYRVTADGAVEPAVEDPLGCVLGGPANLAFGGPGLRRVVVANLGLRHLTVGELGVTGLPLRYPRLSAGSRPRRRPADCCS
jgi:sugar lactone lactonase YvrE